MPKFFIKEQFGCGGSGGVGGMVLLMLQVKECLSLFALSGDQIRLPCHHKSLLVYIVSLFKFCYTFHLHF